ncbi:MAG: S-methyl-5-thioribose-1-phosphate isomerase [Candidatus Aenigmarchaeota archaeon]|nr:S-methyl-5-thioribose-1-phosphate isomerase [Candidatus Aenigmarchaeota archaeon]
MLVNGRHYRTVWLEKNKMKMINQLLLPHAFEIVSLRTTDEIVKAIKTMVVRGAPAIGATAAYGMALGVASASKKNFDAQIAQTAKKIKAARPTAYDLFHGVDFILDSIKSAKTPEQKKRLAIKAAEAYANASAKACEKIGEHGSKLIKNNYRIATHCNAGWIACVDWGTALSPIYFAKRQNKNIFVWVDETRPRLQGAKLTSWELLNEGVAHAVIADNALGHYMRRGEVDMMIVGADRIAANGDFANKIGTYEKAVLAKENKIPFYVAAPRSTFDLGCKSGSQIVIEERDEGEIHFVGQCRVTPKGAKARNPAFDVTPAKYVTGFITPLGIIKPRAIVRAFRK